jgi:carboxyl-terminal processing protease
MRIVTALFIFTYLGCFSQSSNFASKAKRLKATFNVHHFYTMDNSEKTSSEIIELFTENLDDRGVILIANDIKKLNEKGSELLVQIEAGKNDYEERAEKIYLSALKRTDSILSALTTKTLNFSENDTVYFLPYNSSIFYSPTLKYHGKRIERFIKSRSYERVLNTDGFEKLTEKEFNTKANEFSKSLIINFQKGIRELIEQSNKTVESTLLNAIALRYDPHSNYFTEEQNNEFKEALSSKVESFGFNLDEDADGNIIISEIEPGGSAWLSNQINEGDFFQSVIIAKTKYSNEDKTIIELVDKIINTEEKEILLIVKKQNGQIRNVKLVKQKVTSEENNVKGYVLKDDIKKVGYISLPSFYTDMDNNNLPGCANDVAKEILKLEKDSISGLIIDLRNNGGGSMLEAMNLAGIFVDEGPLFIYKEKNKKPTLNKDVNRGSIFKKPILVMINELSASASELFSNIVKDYNLGLVVGQTSYGKGTSQTLLPLDTSIINNKSLLEANKDFIKMTDGKFYRLNCSTHQGVGVVPDIFLPKFPSYATVKENQEKFYIKADTVVKKVMFNPNPPINISGVHSKYEERTRSSQEIKRFKQSADSLTAYLNTTQKVLIKFNEYKRYKLEGDKLFNSFESASRLKNPRIICLNNTFDEKLSNYNNQVKTFNEEIVKSIEGDILINESFSILIDLINQHK